MTTQCDLVKVTQLTNVTTQYGMTSTQNAYMWMFGFAGEGQGFLDWKSFFLAMISSDFIFETLIKP